MIIHINYLAENWMAYFAYAVLQNTLFLAVIFLLLYLLREKHAGIKYSVAALGMIKLLIPPFLPLTITESSNLTPGVNVGEITALNSVAEATSPTTLSVPAIFFLIWTGTILIMAGYAFLSMLQLKWQLRGATFIEQSHVEGKTIGVYSSPNISVPMSTGLFPRRVYVPLLWSELSDELRLSLLRHEVAHIKRRDGLFGALQMLAQALYFFHPLVWILTRRLNEYREMACDDIAVNNSTVTPLIYSRCLVDVAEHILPACNYSSASTLIKQKNRLYHRVNYQVKENTMKKLSKRASRLIWMLLLILIVPLSWYCKKESVPPPPPADKANIYGTITDAESGEPLAGANIILQNTNQGAGSDSKGNYVIQDILPGEYSLVCTYIGYKPQRVKATAEKGRSSAYHFKLEPSPVPVDVVTITGKREEEKPEVTFVPYDEPPVPLGGAAAIANNLIYPEEAKQRGIEGMVLVQAYINEKGRANDVRIFKSELPESCNEAAKAAILKTEFKPAKQRGEAVAVWITVPILFKLEKDKTP